jgi:hypothetical protein
VFASSSLYNVVNVRATCGTSQSKSSDGVLLEASSESMQKIKFARATVGKISVIAVAALAAVVALAHGLLDAILIAIAALAVIVFASL